MTDWQIHFLKEICSRATTRVDPAHQKELNELIDDGYVIAERVCRCSSHLRYILTEAGTATINNRMTNNDWMVG